MIDIETEQMLPLSEAPNHPLLRQGRRAGRPINRSTLERWRTLGVRGVRLDTALVGGTRFTSVQALLRFFAQQNATPAGPTPAQVQRDHARADAELEAAGV